MKEAQSKLEEYQTQMQTHLPIQKRAELLAKIAKQNDSPFAQLKALKRADELDGIVTDVERLKARKTDEEREYQPMFVLPPGVSVDVVVNQRNLTINQQTAPGSGDNDQLPMRNATAGSTEEITPDGL
jgi:hypothetical protein